MGFFSFLTGKKNRKPRGKAKSADERYKIELTRYLRDIRNNPMLREKIMQKVIEKEFGIKSDDDSSNEITRLAKSLKNLREAGIPVDPSRAGKYDWLENIFAPLGEGLGRAFVQMQQEQQLKQLQQMGQQHTTIEQPLALQQPATPQRSQPTTQQPPQEEENVSDVSEFLIGQLEGKPPEEAAHWLLTFPAPQAREFAQTLASTSDERLPELLSKLASNEPRLAGFIAWLRARPEWLVATVRAVRRQSGGQQAESGMGI